VFKSHHQPSHHHGGHHDGHHHGGEHHYLPYQPEHGCYDWNPPHCPEPTWWDDNHCWEPRDEHCGGYEHPPVCHPVCH